MAYIEDGNEHDKVELTIMNTYLRYSSDNNGQTETQIKNDRNTNRNDRHTNTKQYNH